MKNITKMQIFHWILLYTTILNANSNNYQRGSIITQDKQYVSKNTPDGVRAYPFQKSLTPLSGYIGTDGEGLKGVEQYENDNLTLGNDIYLNINMRLQQNVESILDNTKIKTDADEVLAAVMDSRTGKVLAMATSNRYDPAYITINDIPALVPKFAEYPYEPGSVMMPITLALVLDKNLITPDTIFNTYNGKMDIENGMHITDAEKFDFFSASDIIIHSSNIGIAQISWLLAGKEFRDGLTGFGFNKPSGIDLSRDLPGLVKPIELLENKLHRANSSYGYGMMVTFTQLLNAYNIFNNDGFSVTPKIINYNAMDREKSAI